MSKWRVKTKNGNSNASHQTKVFPLFAINENLLRKIVYISIFRLFNVLLCGNYKYIYTHIQIQSYQRDLIKS